MRARGEPAARARAGGTEFRVAGLLHDPAEAACVGEMARTASFLGQLTKAAANARRSV